MELGIDSFDRQSLGSIVCKEPLIGDACKSAMHALEARSKASTIILCFFELRPTQKRAFGSPSAKGWTRAI